MSIDLGLGEALRKVGLCFLKKIKIRMKRLAPIWLCLKIKEN